MFKDTIRPLFMLSPPSLGPDSWSSRHQVTKKLQAENHSVSTCNFFCSATNCAEEGLWGARRVIRRRKAFFGEKAPFPVAGNRSPENFTAFPPRETVFRAIFPLSRGGKPFF